VTTEALFAFAGKDVLMISSPSARRDLHAHHQASSSSSSHSQQSPDAAVALPMDADPAASDAAWHAAWDDATPRLPSRVAAWDAGMPRGTYEVDVAAASSFGGGASGRLPRAGHRGLRRLVGGGNASLPCPVEILGDTNGDCVFDVEDVEYLQHFVVGSVTSADLSPWQESGR